MYPNLTVIITDLGSDGKPDAGEIFSRMPGFKEAVALEGYSRFDFEGRFENEIGESNIRVKKDRSSFKYEGVGEFQVWTAAYLAEKLEGGVVILDGGFEEEIRPADFPDAAALTKFLCEKYGFDLPPEGFYDR